MTSTRSRTLGGLLWFAVAFAAALVSACQPGPPPGTSQSELPPDSPSTGSQPALPRAPETFTLEETAALYEEIRNEMENPDPELVARLELDPKEIQENTREFETGVPYRQIPGLRDSLLSFEREDFSSAHDQLETAFTTFIVGKCFAAHTSGTDDRLLTARVKEECIDLPEEQVVAVDPLFDYLPEPGKGGLRFSVLRQEAAFKIATLLRVLAALAAGVEVTPTPVGTAPPSTEVEPIPVATLAPGPSPEVVPQQPQVVRPRTHTVARGETLLSIAMSYGTSVDELIQLNNVPNRDFIYAGQTLVLPERVEATPVGTPTATLAPVPSPTTTPTSSSPLP